MVGLLVVGFWEWGSYQVAACMFLVRRTWTDRASRVSICFVAVAFCGFCPQCQVLLTMESWDNRLQSVRRHTGRVDN